MGFANGRLVEVVLKATHDSDQDTQVNVLHYDLIDSTYPAHDNDPQQLADDFRDDVLGPFGALYDSSWTIEPVVVQEARDPQHPNDPRASWVSGTAAAGTRGTSSEGPRAICMIATLLTGSIGKRYTGRMHIGGSWRVTDYVNDTWQSSALTLAETFLAAIPVQPDISTGVSPAGCNWCVYSRTQRAQHLDPYASHITSYLKRTSVRYLRTRQP